MMLMQDGPFGNRTFQFGGPFGRESPAPPGTPSFPAEFRNKKRVPDLSVRNPTDGSLLNELVHEDQADDEGEEGEAFNKGGGDDHFGADGALGLGLTGDGFDGGTADVADATGRASDADACTDHDASGADADAEVADHVGGF